MNKILIIICFVLISLISFYVIQSKHADNINWLHYRDMTKTIAFEYPQNWYVIDENINSGSLHILSYDITNPALKPHRFDEGMTKIEIIRIYNPETIPQTEYIKVPGDNKDYLIISFLGDKSNRPLYNRILESLTFTEE